MSVVKTGIDRIDEPEIKALLSGARLGVISAASGISADYRYTIDILCEKFNVCALFAPEHGIRGALGPGERVDGGVDTFTGVRVRSLYRDLAGTHGGVGGGDSPAPDALGGAEVLVFDMQDVGSRYFTYASTLFCIMKSCAAAKKPLILLDRPNPIGGETEGGCLDMKFSSFIGMTSTPIRHGMTLGELAAFYNGEYSLACELYVVKLSGWRRSMYYEDTGLPFVKPSPNLPTLDSIAVYNGTCLLSGTNVSEGRGTTTPFTTFGAPYIDPIRLTGELNALKLSGVMFSPAFFIPAFSKYPGTACYGSCLHITNKRALRPVELGVKIIRTVQRLYPGDFAYRAPASQDAPYHIDLASGSTDIRDNILSADEINEKWSAQAAEFDRKNSKYKLYE